MTSSGGGARVSGDSTVKARIAALAFAALWACEASAASFDAFYGFGDSSIDSGWWSGALTSGQCDGVTPPCATGSPGKDALISSAIANGANGAPVGAGFLMNSQIIAQHFGLTALPANQPGGTNYAISGSLAVGPPGNLNPNANLPSVTQQMTNYLGTHANLADSSALYLISAGGNDITFAQDTIPNPANRPAYIVSQAQAFANAIMALQVAGAQHIIVNGLPGTGNLATLWTSSLFADLSALNVTFIGADIAGMVQTVKNDPTFYGFTAATVDPGVVGGTTGSACVTQTGAAATTSGWGQWCAATPASPDHAYLRDANAETESFYSDDQHFSAAGQVIEANFDIALIEGTTPLPATLPLFTGGLGALGLLGWRRKRKQAA
jgi:outer membrane lipase/esterase